MSAVEIERAISELAEKPFDRQEFPFQFLEALGNKDTTLKRLRQPSRLLCGACVSAKSRAASGKSRALMFIAVDTLHN
jgi:hypothetical protein